MASRKLVLRKETLTELSTAELGAMIGGSGPTCGACGSDFQQCLTGLDCIATLQDCVVTLKSC